MLRAIPRRRVLAASAVAAAALGGRSGAADTSRAAADPGYRIRRDGIRHSVMGWCFNPMDTLELARHAKAIGLVGIEGIDRRHYAAVRDLGLSISLVSSHGFAEGPCDPRFAGPAVAKLAEAIDVAAAVGSKKVITFTGMRFDRMDDDRAAADCLAAWKQVLPEAERKGITLCLEHLNSRDASHPMKGHPGYFGDDVDFCLDLVRRMGSPNFKLLFDVYHVSIMNGDIIRRIREHADAIGHVHTAGNPGRGELDDTQEIDYPAVMRALAAAGYHDFVAHEFIPTWNDPVLALRHAAMVCDV
ncbi:MAG: TIM barrel protein [Planctomycetaceae bacterium]